MEVIALGTSAAHPTVERASSGYLIKHGNIKVLVDIGNGVFRNLLRWLDPNELDALIISHLHQDHFIDIYPLFYYLHFHKSERLPLAVYAPKDAFDFIARIMPDSSLEGLKQVYKFIDLDDKREFSLGDLNARSYKMAHYPETYGFRFEGEGSIVAYSSDTDYDEALLDLAKNADVFICEATMQQEYEYLKHLTAYQAGEIAQTANVKTLVLTHIWPDFNVEESKMMASKFFNGKIIVAQDNMTINA